LNGGVKGRTPNLKKGNNGARDEVFGRNKPCIRSWSEVRETEEKDVHTGISVLSKKTPKLSFEKGYHPILEKSSYQSSR